MVLILSMRIAFTYWTCNLDNVIWSNVCLKCRAACFGTDVCKVGSLNVEQIVFGLAMNL